MLALSGLSVADLKDFKKVSKHLSRDVMLEWFALNTYTPVILGNILHKFKDGPYAHADLGYLAKEVEAKTEEVFSRFSSNNTQSNTPSYTIQDVDEEFFVIHVDQGFIDDLRLRDRSLRFISECLKIQYKYSSLNVVASTEIYRTYLNLLNARVPFSF